MDLHDTLVFGRRRGFVFLRYVAMALFFLSQLATYFVILNAVMRASDAMNALGTFDFPSILAAISSFRISGAFGTFIGVLRNLGTLVIPLYFMATLSFVLNLNRGEMGRTVRRNAVMAVIVSVAEYFIYTTLIAFVALFVMAVFTSLETHYSDVIGAIDEIVAALGEGGIALPGGNAEQALEIGQNFVTTQLILLLIKNLPSFNLFLDVLLCLLMGLFFCFRPKWANTRGKLAFFRSLGALPILYIVVTYVLGGLMRTGVISPNAVLLCFCPARALPHFLFIGCILFLNGARPVRSLKPEQGMFMTHIPRKDYRPDVLTGETAEGAKRRAREAAIFLGVCMLFLCAIDFCFGFLPFAAKWGLGKSYYAVFCIPLFFLYDDRKPTRKRDYSIFSLLYFAVLVVVIVIYLFF